MEKQMKEVIEEFKDKKVLVIGDAILDVYIKGVTDKICREAPVQIINVQEQEYDCGGAANTAINLAALGAETCFLTVIGDDENGRILTNALREKNVSVECIIKDSQRKTIAKKRVVASSNILLRIDEGNIDPVSEELQLKLNERLSEVMNSFDAVILSDYEYGLINESSIVHLIQLKKQTNAILIVDSKNPAKFRKLHPFAVKPNYEEAISILKLPKLQNRDRVEQILENEKRLMDITGAHCVAATIDMEGTLLFEKGKSPYRIYTEPQDNKRSIGAGDTFISAFTLAVLAGADPRTAAEIGAAASAVILKKEGTVVCTTNDLIDYFNENPKYILRLEELILKVNKLKKEGKRIVFTNGCFDILHRGHVNFLNHAKLLGDILIVAINTDESIKRVKGEERPINSLEDRIEVLSALQSVDFLFSFEEDTSADLIKALQPEVFVKGGTYTIESIPEALLVRQLGGEVKILTSDIGLSTTRLISKIREAALHHHEENNYAKAIGLE